MKHEPKDLDEIFLRLQKDDDRVAITVAASMIEYALERVISIRLRKPRNDTEADQLFSENGILGTFSEKIAAAYFLKIIGPKARREIDLIRQIRNQAAHDMNPISFEKTSQIASRCKELRFGAVSVADNKDPTDLRWKFLVIASFFISNLMMRGGDAGAEVHKAYKQLAPDLDR